MHHSCSECWKIRLDLSCINSPSKIRFSGFLLGTLVLNSRPVGFTTASIDLSSGTPECSMEGCAQCASMLLIRLLVLVSMLACEPWMVVHVAVSAIVIHLWNVAAKHAQFFKSLELVWTSCEVRFKLFFERTTPIDVRWRSNLVPSANLHLESLLLRMKTLAEHHLELARKMPEDLWDLEHSSSTYQLLRVMR